MVKARYGPGRFVGTGLLAWWTSLRARAYMAAKAPFKRKVPPKPTTTLHLSHLTNLRQARFHKSASEANSGQFPADHFRRQLPPNSKTPPPNLRRQLPPTTSAKLPKAGMGGGAKQPPAQKHPASASRGGQQQQHGRTARRVTHHNTPDNSNSETTTMTTTKMRANEKSW